jgi:hypothetical protein
MKTMSLTAILVSVLACLSHAQDATPLPDTPAPQTKPEVAARLPEHKFWDRENILLFTGVGIVRGMDFASTKNFLARGRQEILIPDDIVYNDAAFAALEAAAAATSIGVSYVFHRTHHHKMERWLSIGHIAVGGFGDVRNYCLKTRQRTASTE